MESLNSFAGSSVHMFLVMAIVLLVVFKLVVGHYISATIHLVVGLAIHYFLEQSPQAQLGAGEYTIIFFFFSTFIVLGLVLMLNKNEGERQE